jgi:hypothetical protein
MIVNGFAVFYEAKRYFDRTALAGGRGHLDRPRGAWRWV